MVRCAAKNFNRKFIAKVRTVVTKVTAVPPKVNIIGLPLAYYLMNPIRKSLKLAEKTITAKARIRKPKRMKNETAVLVFLLLESTLRLLHITSEG